MPAVPKSACAPFRKRLACASAAALLCALIGACGNDADAPDSAAAHAATSNATGTADAADPSDARTDPQANPQANPLAQSAPPALIIETPRQPQTAQSLQTTQQTEQQTARQTASDAVAPLSAAAPEPLATPVIHTVD